MIRHLPHASVLPRLLLVVFVVSCTLASATACQSARLAPDGTPEPPTGSLTENLEWHIRFLASDGLRGRDTGTRESLRAAGYIAEVLRASGLEPAGDDGGWYQVMDLEGLDLTRPPALIFTGQGADAAPANCVHGADYRLMSGIAGVKNARIVTMNDTTIPDMDRSTNGATGPVALFLDLGDPMTGFRFARDKREELAAVADIVIFAGRAEAGESRASPEHLVGRPGAPASIMLNGPILERVRAGELDHVTFDMTGEPPVAAWNVVGRIPGVGTAERPGLADEVVVFTAHYDHVGVSPDKTAEDRIFNGANDDASGVAVLLELARLFADDVPPARTLLFVFVTAEEQGLLGSAYFVEYPLVPLEDIVCDLNFEMLGQPDEGAGGFGKLFVTGFERSNLGPSWVEAGLPFVPDPYPQLQLFFRSDNLAFVRAGIPGHSISTGGAAEHYHKVSDETGTMDWKHMTLCTEVSYEAIVPIVMGTLDPEWVEGGNPADG